MLALRLVRLIETHSETLAQGLVVKLLNSERTRDFQKVPQEELQDRAREVYHNLADWLLSKTESDVELQYTELGRRRAAQGVNFSQFLWALIITKEHIWRFLQTEALVEQPVELFGEFELLRLLEQFFDRALYYASLGYARAQKEGIKTHAVAGSGTASMAQFVP
jgi:hypothetical protein